MAGGNCPNGERRKKRVALSELRDWMDAYAESERGHSGDEDDDSADSDEIELPYSYALSVDLWLAWKQHHIMPNPGGYLQQPRKWMALIHRLNREYNRALNALSPENPRVHVTEDLEDLYAPSGGSGRLGWDELTRS
jgi:hypothetical protein